MNDTSYSVGDNSKGSGKARGVTTAEEEKRGEIFLLFPWGASFFYLPSSICCSAFFPLGSLF